MRSNNREPRTSAFSETSTSKRLGGVAIVAVAVAVGIFAFHAGTSSNATTKSLNVVPAGTPATPTPAQSTTMSHVAPWFRVQMNRLMHLRLLRPARALLLRRRLQQSRRNQHPVIPRLQPQSSSARNSKQFTQALSFQFVGELGGQLFRPIINAAIRWA